MRILFVNQTAQVSGAEYSLLTLLKGLDGTVESLVACPEGELRAALRDMQVASEPIIGTRASFKLHPFYTSRGLAEIGLSALQTRRIIRRLAPDLVYANTTRAALIALLGRSRSGPPVLAHIRDWAPEGRLSRFVLSYVGRRADIIADSNYVARQFDGLRLRCPVRVIYNPIDLKYFDPGAADGASIRREFSIPQTAVVLSVVGQITPWKGQDDAIKTLARLVATGRDVVLLVAGSAKFTAAGGQFDTVAYERDLHRLARECGVCDRVRFLGERSDVPDVLAATDVLLLPSWREAFGRVVIEAMAMGVPVAATNTGGPAETVRPGVDGILLPSRDPDAWSRALESLVDDSDARKRMGRQAKTRAQDFGPEEHVTQILRLFNEIVS